VTEVGPEPVPTVRRDARSGLGRHERVRRRFEYEAAQNRGQKLHTRSFLVFVYARTGEDPSGAPRLGVTVSKKVGNAVVRNRIKRMIREAFRTRKSLFPPGRDIVVVAKRAAAEADSASVVEQLETLCRRHLRRR
jgi:ribonuclease P protein component